VVNTSYKIAPWADALYAMDAAWWEVYGRDVNEAFSGLKFTQSGGVKGVKRVSSHRTFNSGAGAIMLAKELGAARVALLGYDGTKTGGRAHWHDDHPRGLGNAGAANLWPDQFKKLAPTINLPVVNCSRQTAITVFKILNIEDFLR